MRIRNDCRMCGGELRMVLKLADTPLANSYPTEPNSGEFHPLELMQCVECDHVQLHHVPAPTELYGNYKYATPAVVSGYLQERASRLKGLYSPKTVLEIGSNNGLFLEAFENEGLFALGIDPAATKGRNILKTFFNENVAKTVGEFDLIVANNVLAHIDDLGAVFRAIDICLASDGVLVFEVQYLPSMAESGMFDMIYHEHHDYHTLKPWPKFLKKYGLVIKHIEFPKVHGGSVRVHCQRPGKGIAVPQEQIDWRGFAKTIQFMKEDVRAVLGRKQIKMFGAPAKATTLVHHFGIQDSILYAVDSTPEKEDRYIPGTGIKIFPEKILGHTKSTTEMFLASWNFAEVVRKKYPDIRFIVPGEKFQQAA